MRRTYVSYYSPRKHGTTTMGDHCAQCFSESSLLCARTYMRTRAARTAHIFYIMSFRCIIMTIIIIIIAIGRRRCTSVRYNKALSSSPLRAAVFTV